MHTDSSDMSKSRRRVGKVQEDGSFRTRAGRTFDPDTGQIRATRKPKWDAKQKRWR